MPAQRYRLEIWRESDHSVIKYNWNDEGGTHHGGFQLEPPEDIERLSQMICKPFIDFLAHGA